MALDLFKRVETRKGLFAVEKITLIYNLLTSILILFLFQEMDHPVQMLADRVVIAGMTFLLMYLYRLAPCKFSAFVRIAIQMSLLSYWYPDTFEFNRIFPNLDHVFADVGERAVQYGVLLLLSDDSAGGGVVFPLSFRPFREGFVRHRHRFLHLLPYLYFRPRCRAAVLLPRHWKRPCGARYLPVHR